MKRRSKNKFKMKVALPLAFFLILILVLLLNKSPINGLVPIDYLLEPWPVQQACPLPAEKTDNNNTKPAS
jgi:hypothetical protein